MTIIITLITITVLNYEKVLNQSQRQNEDQDLRVIIVGGGSGEIAKQGSTVTILYSGYILSDNGSKDLIDKDQLYTFTLGKGEVIRAWEEGILGMRVGEVVEITTPPSYAYGDTDEISFLPPNSTLFFEITMMSIESSN